MQLWILVRRTTKMVDYSFHCYHCSLNHTLFDYSHTERFKSTFSAMHLTFRNRVFGEIRVQVVFGRSRVPRDIYKLTGSVKVSEMKTPGLGEIEIARMEKVNRFAVVLKLFLRRTFDWNCRKVGVNRANMIIFPVSVLLKDYAIENNFERHKFMNGSVTILFAQFDKRYYREWSVKCAQL